jgi:hypothetical protein
MLDELAGQQGFRVAAEIAAGDNLANRRAQFVIVARPIIGFVIDHTFGDPREQCPGQLFQ